MVNKLAGIFILCTLSFSALSQTTPAANPPARPDIPGTFTLELGLNRALSAPDNFDIGLWGSRTVNVYYQYEMQILKSKFSFVPGIGLSLERFKFRDGDIISYADDAHNSVELLPISEHQITTLKKSQLVTNFVEAPLEFRYTSNPDDPARSFKISVGGRVGYLYDSFSKIKFKEDGESKQVKDKQTFNLNRFRYGVYGKVGFGNFSLFGYYNLSPMFKEDEGFFDTNQEAINFNTFTAGISLSSF
jgi:hypothetical protein